MSYLKTLPLLALILVAFTACACSSSFGEASPPPHNVTVVVPPTNTVSP